VRIVEHRGVHRRHALEDCDAVALDDLERLAAVEAGDERKATAHGNRRVERTRLPERVKERQRPQRDRSLVSAEQADADLDVAQQVPVRELGALRRAGRARRVEHHCSVIRLTPDDLLRGLVALDQPLEGSRLHQHALGARVLRTAVGGVRELRPGEDELRAGVTQVEGDLAILQQRVHRHDRRSRAQRAVVVDREVRDVGQHDPDAIARLHSLRAQHPRDPGSGLVERGVGQLAVVELDRDAVGARRRSAGEQVGKVRHVGLLGSRSRCRSPRRS